MYHTILFKLVDFIFVIYIIYVTKYILNIAPEMKYETMAYLNQSLTRP